MNEQTGPIQVKMMPCEVEKTVLRHAVESTIEMLHGKEMTVEDLGDRMGDPVYVEGFLSGIGLMLHRPELPAYLTDEGENRILLALITDIQRRHSKRLFGTFDKITRKAR